MGINTYSGCTNNYRMDFTRTFGKKATAVILSLLLCGTASADLFGVRSSFLVGEPGDRKSWRDRYGNTLVYLAPEFGNDAQRKAFRAKTTSKGKRSETRELTFSLVEGSAAATITVRLKDAQGNDITNDVTDINKDCNQSLSSIIFYPIK